MRFATKAIHVAQDPDAAFGAIVPPIYTSSTFAWETPFERPAYEYSRYANPTTDIYARALAALENASHCTAFSSGLAAMSAAMSVVHSGEGLILAQDIYGGTVRLAQHHVEQKGIRLTTYDAMDPETMASAGTAKAVIFETPTNPILRVADIAANVAIAKRLGLITIFDNTFASPALQNPLDLGVDIVVHSATKYIGGHSDLTGGAALTNSDQFAEQIANASRLEGAMPSPHDTSLALRGLKTLAIRMKAHCENAQKVAEFLAAHPRVGHVNYPGLPTHPQHALAAKQMSGFGGMLSAHIGNSAADAAKVAQALHVFHLAPSLGGVESLVGYPPTMSHSSLSEAERLSLGIPPNLLRISVGIEHPADLIDDLSQALSTLG